MATFSVGAKPFMLVKVNAEEIGGCTSVQNRVQASNGRKPVTLISLWSPRSIEIINLQQVL
jgi:hypothetical protein